ncbi:MAG: hypothetical protein H5U02_02600 [Clostridia bacterium]|nr:hypothetical protein [Clostridia bacterium]
MGEKLNPYLDQNYRQARIFLAGPGQDLVREIALIFQEEIRKSLKDQSYLTYKDRLVLSANATLLDILQRQVAFAWSLGFAAGAAGFKPQNTTCTTDS